VTTLPHIHHPLLLSSNEKGSPGAPAQRPDRLREEVVLSQHPIENRGFLLEYQLLTLSSVPTVWKS